MRGPNPFLVESNAVDMQLKQPMSLVFNH